MRQYWCLWYTPVIVMLDWFIVLQIRDVAISHVEECGYNYDTMSNSFIKLPETPAPAAPKPRKKRRQKEESSKTSTTESSAETDVAVRPVSKPDTVASSASSSSTAEKDSYSSKVALSHQRRRMLCLKIYNTPFYIYFAH